MYWIFVLTCISIVGAQLPSQNASEGPCNPDIINYLQGDVNLPWLLTPRNYYVPMGSQALYRHYAEGFLGRPLADETELAEMKLRIDYALSLVTYNTAFPDRSNPPYFSQLCTVKSVSPINPGDQVECIPLLGGPGTNMTAPGIKSTLDSLLWTDNSSTFLVVRCPSDDIQDYKVLSTKKTISESAKTIIFNKLQQIGVDVTKAYYMNYD